jgi:DNA-binding HxlR family transcriptional regulator
MKVHNSEKELLALYRVFFLLGDNTSLKILYELDRYGEKSFTELLEHLDTNPGTLSKKLKILEEAGIVSADKTHDKRRVFYAISDHERTVRKLTELIDRLAMDLSL